MNLAGCIVLDQRGRVLLLHRNIPGWQQWEIPGGKIEPSESAKQAAVREVKEELHLAVEIVKMLGAAEFTEDGHTMHYTWFETKILFGEIK